MAKAPGENLDGKKCKRGGIIVEIPGEDGEFKAKTFVVKVIGNRVYFADGSYGDKWARGVQMKHIHRDETCTCHK